MKITKVNFILKTPQPDIILDGETSDLSIGNFHLNVRLFPGHSPGSCVLQQGKYLFTGDILYKKGLGFNSFPDEKRDILKDSINRIFETYSDDSIVLPGHGAAENIGNIKKNNLELKAFLQNELV